MDIIEELVNNNQELIDDYIKRLIEKLYSAPRYNFKHERQWSSNNNIPGTAGVYGVFDGDTLCYVGETACLQERMNDMYDTRNHTIRRNIAKLDFEYTDTSSRKKADDETEEKITQRMEQFKIAWIKVELGRTELEDHIMKLEKPVYNTKTKRILNRKKKKTVKL